MQFFVYDTPKVLLLLTLVVFAMVDTDEHMILAFTEHGVTCLQQIITDERAAGRAPPPAKGKG